MGDADLESKRPRPVSRINWSGLQQAMEAVVAASPENLFYRSVCHPVTPVPGGMASVSQDGLPGMASPGPIC